MSRETLDDLKEKIYFMGEAIKLLGVCRTTMYNWIRSGKIKTYKLGREVLIEKKAVESLR